MVSIKTSHKELNEILNKKLSIEEIESILFEMGFELESYYEDELTIEITPERLDLISVQGLGRAIKAFINSENPNLNYEIKKDNYLVYVTNKVKTIRPRVVCTIIKNLKLDENKIKQIIYVQENLHKLLARGRVKGAIGIYPLDIIKMPITYTASKPEEIKFIPLGKNTEMNGFEILELHETGREYAHLLEGKEIFPYFIDASGEILSMPPIINSEKTGRVTTKTKNIFIECSGSDDVLLNELLTNIVCMFKDMGGEIYEVNVNYENKSIETFPKLEPQEIKVNKSTIKKLLNLDLKDIELKKLVKKMMYEILKIEKDHLILKAPCYRRDIWHEIDVADDIARSYGYNNFKLVVPDICTIGETLKISDLKEEISQIMIGLKHIEVYTNILTSNKENIEFMNLNEEDVKYMKVINGNENQTMMRVSLIPELLKCLSSNKSLQLPQRIFENGIVVSLNNKKDVKCENKNNLCVMVTNKDITFTELKQILNYILQTMNLNCEICPAQNSSFIDGRFGEIIINNLNVGIIGEIHPIVLNNFELLNPVVVFEINLDSLLILKNN